MSRGRPETDAAGPEPEHEQEQARRPRGRGARWAAEPAAAGSWAGPYGPLFLLVPLLSLVAGILWTQRGALRSHGERAQPPRQEERTPVAGWQAEERLVDGTLLVARLSPLHAEPARQAFDAKALRSALSRSRGEPWRLSLTRSTAPDREDGAPPALRLEEITIEGSLGRLEPAVARAGAAQALPADPLRVLLSVPSDPLAPGEEVSLVLWGEMPEGELVLRGLGGRELALAPNVLPRTAVVRSLARLEAQSDAAAGVEDRR